MFIPYSKIILPLYKGEQFQPMKKKISGCCVVIYCNPFLLTTFRPWTQDFFRGEGQHVFEGINNTTPTKKTREYQPSYKTVLGLFVIEIPKYSISRLLTSHNIRTYFKPTQQIRKCCAWLKISRIRSVVNRIPCLYVETTKQLRLDHLQKRAVSEHAFQEDNTSHNTISNLLISLFYRPCHFISQEYIEKAIEIHKHWMSWNKRDEVRRLSRVWFLPLDQYVTDNRCKVILKPNSTNQSATLFRKRVLVHL